MYTYYFMLNNSWSHIIIEEAEHFCPKSGTCQTFETLELLVPEVYLAIKAFNPVVA